MSKLNKNSKRIHAISFVDISYSWGPAIHFVELWNEFSLLSNIEVTGYAVLERKKRPYTKINFKLKYLNLADNKNTIRRRLAKYLYDFYLFITFIFLKPTRVYIRQSKFGLFLVLALFIRRHEVYIEMNGLAKEDNTNSMSKSGYFKRLYCNLMELLYMKLPGVKVISVANKISSTIRRRYRVNNTYTVLNGCSQKLISNYCSTRKENDVLNIGFLGTFTPWDGHEKTSELYEVIKKIRKDVAFHIAGPDVKKTVIYKKYYDNKDFIFYNGVPYSELGLFYNRLDAAFAFDRIDRSVTVEQSTLKLLEYWACKLPILSTAARGNEFIEKYKIGYLVKEDEYNNKDRFRKAVIKFIDSLDTYKENYRNAPLPRTWRDVAEDTKKILNV